jgi:hypothetical protein
MVDRIKTEADSYVAEDDVDEVNADQKTQSPKEAAQSNADARLKVAQEQMAARKEQFQLEQDARAKAFERDQNARSITLDREHNAKQAAFEANAKIAAAQAENDDRAYADGLLTDQDLMHRGNLLAPHHDCILPWQATAEGEPTVKMAFPRTVIVTRSAQDIYGAMWKEDEEQGEKAPARDDGRDFPLGVVAHRSAITPITPGTRVIFYKGYQDVPVSMADHAYLYSNGAYRIDKDGKPETLEARNERLAKGKSKSQSRTESQDHPDDGPDYADPTKTERVGSSGAAPVAGKARFPANPS